MTRRAYAAKLASEGVEADRGSGGIREKVAQVGPLSEILDREQERAGLRDLDSRLVGSPGLSSRQRDAQRIMPRGTPAEVPFAVMERKLPHPDEIRMPLSGRQMKARRKLMAATQRALPRTQAAALRSLMEERGRIWSRLNDALSDSVGDVDALSESDQRTVRRVDRAIQAYEDHSDRGHVVYANVRMPAFINRTSLDAFVDRQFQPGDVVNFDRFTAGGHSLHEMEPDHDPAGRVAVFEVQTRRGMYLGMSDGGNSTGHLLPRGLQLRVVGTHKATYRTRSGGEGIRTVIQLEDITPEPERG